MTPALVQSLPLVRSESGPGAFLRREVIGDATLYLGDCREVLPLIGKVDAVVTDPPYGIGFAAQPTKWQRRAGKVAEAWDNEPGEVDGLLDLAPLVAIWGGNYYPLPLSRGWLVWHKPDAVPSMANAELAWTNQDRNTRQISWSISATNSERVGHPTQKPVRVMAWTLEQLGVPKGATVLDPYMGSGTTGIAALQLGRKFVGIEREPKYFDIACERIRKESEQVKIFDVFDAKPEKFETPSLL